MKALYEILVPTIYGDTMRPIRTRHHKRWDEWVIKLTGGMTIMPPGKGKWVYKTEQFDEKVIPVRIMCDTKYIDRIIKFTLQHYRQKAVMYYVISNDVIIVHAAL